MGQITDLRIREFQKRTGIEPATGKRAARLADMSKKAYELIQVLVLEASGIGDGDGHWHGSDPINSIVNSLAAFERADQEEKNMKGDIWRVGDSDSGKGSHPLRLAHGHAWPSGSTPPRESVRKHTDVNLFDKEFEFPEGSRGCQCDQCRGVNAGITDDDLPF